MRSDSFGFGLRVPHYPELLERGTRVDFVEAIIENFTQRGGRPRRVLERVRRDVPIVLHGVSLSIGASDVLNREHLENTRLLAEQVEAAWLSEHLCFGNHGGHYAHDLWPLPHTEEALAHVSARVSQAQDFLGRQLALENVSSYVEYRASQLSEWEFLSEVAERSDCFILLDLNNVYVNSENHGFSPFEYLDGLPGERIKQLHLAGHSDAGEYLLDDHSARVPNTVWELYRYACQRFGAIPTLIEWDENVPTLPELEAECDRAREIQHNTLS